MSHDSVSHPNQVAAAITRTPLDRRQLLRGALLGAGALGGSSLLAACGGSGGTTATASSSSSAGALAKASGTVTFGSNQSDAVPKAGYQRVFTAFTRNSAVNVKVNTVDHNTFQENINSYLQGQPDDVFTWFSGYRMRFFADQKLASPIDDVWTKIAPEYTPGLEQASTASDGKKYFVPFDQYPWGVFYRKSLFAQHGYQPAKTLDEFTALCKQMTKDGIAAPIAFADKDGWPAMGTFDYLNLRTNGYDFHLSLMGGKESWTDKRVKQVFDTWKGLLPYHQKGALGRTWQESAQSLGKKQAGMLVQGMFVGQQFTGADLADLDFFAFPEVDPAHGQDSIEAPIDGFMMSSKAKNPAAAKALLAYLGTAEAQAIPNADDPTTIPASKNATDAKFSPLQKKAKALIGGAKHVSQFLDRDTRPDFASTVMIPSLQAFIKNPDDIDGLTKSIESQKKSIFTA